MFSTVLFPLFSMFFPVASLFSTATRFGLMEQEMEMQLSGYHRCWGCKLLWMIERETFFMAGSYTQEDIGNHGDEFRARLLFSGLTIFPMYFALLAIMGYWGDTIHIRIHSLQWLEQDNELPLLSFTHIPTSSWHTE